MATNALIPVEEYLRTSYRPDCDYVDGEVQERNSGERWPSSVQMMIGMIFGRNRREWGLVPLPEQRVQVSSTRYASRTQIRVTVPEIFALIDEAPQE